MTKSVRSPKTSKQKGMTTMAKMIGKIRKMWYGQCKYGCCYMRHSKTGVKREEMALVLREAEEEMADDGD